MKIGVLALQGAVDRHARALVAAGAEPVAVRSVAALADVDALVLPGGESTTMSMLLKSSGLYAAVAERLDAGMPALGTCAGMILLGREIIGGRADQRSFGVLDISVRRNAFGRQRDSFEIDLAVSGLDDDRRAIAAAPLRAVFIRAPVVERAGPDVEVLASVDGDPVLVRQGAVLAAAFHPELGDDLRIHQTFVRTSAERSA
ncbi:MAG: pyridoxal 5'-phosphate synthase glutaminase subunit PdxT [Acidimicrobiia bacterium]|nr:pyridoxal 5'-phosphate synthase glutaminase subunit PdxT [Acidimicrobiia bacterium]